MNVPPVEKQCIAHIVSCLTAYDPLKTMTLANRTGRLDFKIKHFRHEHPDSSNDLKSPKAKRSKLMALPEDEIDRLSIEMNPETDSRVLHKLYKTTSLVNLQFFRFYHFILAINGQHGKRSFSMTLN